MAAADSSSPIALKSVLVLLVVVIVLWPSCVSSRKNSNPSFTRGKDIYVAEDSGQYADTWATDISDGDGGKQSLEFVVTAANPDLFKTQPKIDDKGLLTFYPADDAFGATLVTVYLRDDGTSNCDSSCPCVPESCRDSKSYTFTITITGVNDCPTFSTGDVNVDEDAGSTTISNWLSSISKGASNENSQKLTWYVSNDNEGLFSAQPRVVESSGSSYASLTFEAKENTYGKATVTVYCEDDGGISGAGCDTSKKLSIVLTVKSVNDAPTFKMGTNPIQVEEDSGESTFPRWATDINVGAPNEGDQQVSFTLQAVSNEAKALFKTQPSIDKSGTLTFEVEADRNTLSTSAQFYVQASDNAAGTAAYSCSTITSCPKLTIIINSVNDEPSFVAGGDVTVWEDLQQLSSPPTPLAFSVSNWATSITAGNSIEDDSEGQEVEFTVTCPNLDLFDSAPSIDSSGTLQFTLKPHKNGVVTCSAAIKDTDVIPALAGTTSNVLISVLSVNDEPSFDFGITSPLSISQSAGSQSIQNFLKNIKKGPSGADDEESQTLSLQITATPSSIFEEQPTLTFTDATTAKLNFKVKDGETGEAKLTIKLRDNGGVERSGIESISKNFTIQIDSVNTRPTFTLAGSVISFVEDEKNSGYTTSGWATSISPGTGASGDKEKLTQTVKFTLTNSNSALFSAQPAMASNGDLTFTPQPNAYGTATVTVTCTDDASPSLTATETQSFEIRILPKNDAPYFEPGDTISVAECRRSDASSCVHSYPSWAQKLSTAGLGGISNEDSQTLSFSVVPMSGSSSSFSDLFTSPITISAATGDLSFSLKSGAGNTMGTVTLSATLTDSGGTDYGGTNTFVSTFAFEIKPYVPAPSFDVSSSSTLVLFEDSPSKTLSQFFVDVNPGKSPSASGASVSTVLKFTISTSNDNLFDELPRVAFDSETTASLSIKPKSNQEGSAEITITLTSTETGLSAFKKVSVEVKPVNDAPTFTLLVSDIERVEDSGSYTTTIAGDISPGPGSESLSQSVTFILNCTIIRSANASIASASTFFSSQPTIDQQGVLFFALALHVSGTALCGITMKDSGGIEYVPDGESLSTPRDTSTDVKYFTIEVAALNRAPSFVRGSDVAAFEDDGLVTISNWATQISTGNSDLDTPQILTFSVTCTVSSTYFNATLFASAPAIDATSGQLSFALTPNQNGVALCSVVLADDGATALPNQYQSAAQSFTISVVSVNDAPTFTVASGGTSIAVYSDEPNYSFADWASKISTGPAADESTQTFAFDVSTSTSVGEGSATSSLFSVNPSVSSGGTLTFHLSPHVYGSAQLTVCLVDSGGKNNLTSLASLSAISTFASDGSVSHVGSDTTCVVVSVVVIEVNSAPVVGIATATVQVLEDAGTNGTIQVPSFANRILAGMTPKEQTQQSVHLSVECACNSSSGAMSGAALREFLFASYPSIVMRSVAAPTPAASSSGYDTTTVQPSTWVGDLQFVLRRNSNGVCGGCFITVIDSAGATVTSPLFIISVVAVNDPPTFDLSTLPYSSSSQLGSTSSSQQSQFSNTIFTSIVDVLDTMGGPLTMARWATQISAGPQDETPLQQLWFELAYSGDAPSIADCFTQLPSVNSSSGALTFTLGTDAATYSPYYFSVSLIDSGGTEFGGIDRTVGIVNSYNQIVRVVLQVNVRRTEKVPSFIRGADIVVMEDSGQYFAPQWATDINANDNGNVSSTALMAFETTDVDQPILFTHLPHVLKSGDMTMELAPNRYGSTSLHVQLVRTLTASSTRLVSVSSVVSVQVLGVNDPPSFKPLLDTITLLEDANYYYKGTTGQNETKYSFATDASPGPFEENQAVEFVISGLEWQSVLSVNGLTIDSSGVVTKIVSVPNANGVASVEVQLKDNGGTANGGVDTSAMAAQLRVVITPVNDAPTFAVAAADVTLTRRDDNTLTVALGTSAASPVASPSRVSLEGFVNSIKLGPDDESKSQVMRTRKLSCDAESTRIFATAPVLANVVSPFGATSGRADLQLDVLSSAVPASSVCTIVIEDNGGIDNGGVDTATKTFTITFRTENRAPSFTLRSNYFDAVPNAVILVDGFVINLLAGSAAEESNGDRVDRFNVNVLSQSTPYLFSVAPIVLIANPPRTGALSFTVGPVAGSANISLTAVDSFGAVSPAQWIFITVAASIPSTAVYKNYAPSVVMQLTLQQSIEDFSPTAFRIAAANLMTVILRRRGSDSLAVVSSIAPSDVVITAVSSASVVVEFYLGTANANTLRQDVLNAVLVDFLSLLQSDPAFFAEASLTLQSNILNAYRVEPLVVSSTTPVPVLLTDASSQSSWISENFTLFVIILVVIVILLVVLLGICILGGKRNKKNSIDVAKSPPKTRVVYVNSTEPTIVLPSDTSRSVGSSQRLKTVVAQDISNNPYKPMNRLSPVQRRAGSPPLRRANSSPPRMRMNGDNRQDHVTTPLRNRIPPPPPLIPTSPPPRAGAILRTRSIRTDTSMTSP